MSLFSMKTNKEWKQSIIPCFVFSVFFSLTIVIGHPLYNYNSLDRLLTLKGFAVGLLCLLLLSVVFTFCLMAVMKLLKRLDKQASSVWRIYKYPWLLGVLFFISWLPCYLAYYPGIVAYDMDTQLPQILGTVSYSKYHPPLHTFLYQLCHELGNIIGISGLVIYSIGQMCLLAVAFAYLVRFFISLRVNNWIVLASILFICVNPIIAILSFTPAKDVSFAIFMILFSVEFCQFIRQRKSGNYQRFTMVRMVCFGTLCCLFRNNMIYALLAAVVIGAVLLRKGLKQFLIGNLCIVLLYFIVNGPFYSALGIEDGNPREMLSVPLQQIAHVMVKCNPKLSAEELETLNGYLPVEDLVHLYNPRFADPVKNAFDSEHFKEDKGSFLKLWFQLLAKYPKEYITAFLDLNLPYWYIDASTLDLYANRMYLETFIYSPEITHYDVVRESKIPWLYNKYEVFANFAVIQKIPGISHALSISLPVWVLLFTGLVLIVKERKAYICVILPHICYWLTFLLGPVSNLRYVFPIIALYPLYLAFIVNTKAFSATE